MRQLLAVLSSLALVGSLYSSPAVGISQQPNNHYEQALQAFNQGDFDSAYIHLKNRLQQAPNNLAAKILMGKVLLTTGYIREAEIEFTESLEFGADANLVAEPLGRTMLFLQQYEKILTKEFNGLQREQQIGWAIIQATALLNLQRVEQARDLYIATLQRSPQNIKLLNALSSLEINQGNLQQANAYLSQAFSISAQNLVSLRLKAELLEKQGEINAAIALYVKAREQNHNDPLLMRSLATAYIKINKDKQAQQVIQEILKQTPDDPMALLLQSWLYSRQNENDNARTALTQLTNKMAGLPTEIIRNTPDLQYIKALASYAQGSIEATRSDLAEYVAANPQNIQAVKVLLDVYQRLGKIDLAVELIGNYSKILEQDLPFGLLACDLYLQANRTHRAISLLKKLQNNFGKNPQLIVMQAKTLSARGKVKPALQHLESQVELKNTALFLLTRTMILIEDKQFAAADTLADRLIELDSEQSDYLNVKAITSIKLRNWSAAEQALNKILQTKPNHFSARYNMVNVYAATGRMPLAKTTTKQLLHERQNYGPAILLLARLEHNTGEAATALKRVEQLVLQDSTNVAAKEQLANYLITAKQYDKALRVLDELSKSTAIKPVYISQQAYIYEQLNNAVMARRELTKLFAHWQQDPSQLRNLAARQKKIADIHGARKSLKTAIKLSPDSMLLQFELTKLDIEQGELAAAQKRLTALPNNIKQDPNFLMLQGDIANAEQNFNEAYTQYAAAVMADNSFSQAFAKLYQLASNNIKPQQFSNLAEQLIQNKPNNLFYKNLLADFYLNQLQVEAALEHYQTLAKADNNPNRFAVFNNLAAIYLSKGDLIKATKYTEAAYQAAPEHPAVVDTRGWLLAKQGNYQVALDTLRQAFSMNSNDPAIRYHLAYTLHKLGRVDEATRELKASLATKVSFIEREAAQALYNSLL